jgi:hypothetical protein
MGSAVMGEHIMKVGVGELTIVRLTCQTCKTIAELSLADLHDRFPECKCPFCQNAYLHGGATSPNPFEKLQTAIRLIQQASNLSMEFVLPADEK